MKKIVLLAIAFITIQATAQERKRERSPEQRKERAQFLKNLTPQERAELKTKKMTLHLDLNEAQQKKIMALNLENAKKHKKLIEERKAKKIQSEDEKPSKEERLKAINSKLDHQIEMKQKMKSILNDEQYEKWSKSLNRRNAKVKKRIHEKRKKRKNNE